MHCRRDFQWMGVPLCMAWCWKKLMDNKHNSCNMTFLLTCNASQNKNCPHAKYLNTFLCQVEAVVYTTWTGYLAALKSPSHTDNKATWQGRNTWTSTLCDSILIFIQFEQTIVLHICHDYDGLLFNWLLFIPAFIFYKQIRWTALFLKQKC